MKNTDDPHILTKTHSASNVFSRTTNANPLRNSLDTIDNPFSVQYGSDRGKNGGDSGQFESENRTPSVSLREGGGAVLNTRPVTFDQYMLRRGSSFENVNSGGVDVNGNSGMKKFKYETEVIRFAGKFRCGLRVPWFVCRATSDRGPVHWTP